MEKKYFIYKHTNKINNKIYIGQTCQKPEYRWNHGEGYKGSPRFYSAIQKYGWNNFIHEILYSNLTLEEANSLEDILIKQYKSNDLCYGYNLDRGGNNKGTSEETKIKQSIAAQNKPIVSEITKQKLSVASEKREQEKKDLGIKKTRAVKCLNTGEVFESCRAAANWCGLAGTSGIASVCRNGKQKTAGVHPETKEKLKWEYVN